MVDLEIRWGFALATPFHSTGNLPPLGVNRALVRDAHGRPILTATAVKGLLRAGAGAVLRAWGMQICTPPNPAEMCPPTKLCLLCRIFGHPRAPSPLRFFDARPQGTEAATLPIALRTHVALSRRRRAALEGRLFTVEAMGFEGVRWEARIVGRFPDAAAAKEAAAVIALGARAVHAIGGQRTRGLGWIAEESITLSITLDRQGIALADLQPWWERGHGPNPMAAPDPAIPPPDRPAEG